MKKILIALMAGGICLPMGLNAQATFSKKYTVANAKAEQQIEKKDIKASAFTTKDEPVRYDTIVWPGEYADPEGNCARYISFTMWGLANGNNWNDPTTVRALTPYGNAGNGTGEVGVTVLTKRGQYDNFIGIKLTDYVVVGAVVSAWRITSASWTKLGYNTQTPPDMPFVLKAYSTVVDQEVYKGFWDEAEMVEIPVTYPVNRSEAIATDTYYLPVSLPHSSDPAIPQPTRLIGGLFKDGARIAAGKDFALAIENPQSDITIDTIWNWSMSIKSATECAAADEYVAWNLVNWKPGPAEGEGDIYGRIVTPTTGTYTDFIPEGNPQLDYDNDSALFMPALGSGLQMTTREEYLPMLYPIITEGVSNETAAKDTYAKTVSVSPIPATDKLTIVSIDPINRVDIYNLAGILITSIKTNENIVELDVNNVVTGTYIAKITTAKGVVSKKIVVR